jgi:hypothetical protein
MSLDARSPAGQSPAATRNPATAARLARLRTGSLAVLVLLVAEYLLGMYVNLYVAVPAADAGHGLGTAISGGPAVLSAHAVLGLLLTLGALAVLVTAISIRRPAGIAISAAGLAAMGLAASAGSSFTAAGQPGDSMAMAVLTGVAMLCYGLNLYRQQAAGPPG